MVNTKVDFYFEKEKAWKEEIMLLRTIVLDCHLKEELKWGCPCYTLPGVDSDRAKNIVLIHVFKGYCALLFFKGALLNDSAGVLIQQTENVQAARQIRFTDQNQILDQKAIIQSYVYQAIEIEEKGLKVELKKSEDYNIPEEFRARLDDNIDLRNAFESLTPGRQRAYIFHFSQAKLAKTRIARIEKYLPNILNGKGIDD